MAADKQFEGFYVPNSTQVPDDLFDKFMADLSGAELKVLLYIIRRTFGFKRQQDAISISQLVNGITKKNGEVLDKGTGLSRATAVLAAKSLEKRGFIVRTKKYSAEHGDEATAYSLKIATLQEKKPDNAFRRVPQEPSSEPAGGVYENHTPAGGLKIRHGGSSKISPGGVQKSYPQDTGEQDTQTVNVNSPPKSQKPAKRGKSKLAELPNLAISEEEIDASTKQLVRTFDDEHSRNYFRLAAAKVPRSVIGRTISDIRKQNPENPSRLFTFRMELYAQEHRNDALYNRPVFHQNAQTLADQMTIKSGY
jgi:Bacteriophage replication protein O